MSMNEITPEMVEAGFRALYKNRGAYIQPQNKANCLAKVERLLTAALAAAPAPQPVDVKPLEWVDTCHEDETTSKAITPFGDYACTSWSTGEWRSMYGPSSGWKVNGTKEHIQAAAQADYEQRIRSALVSAPPAEIDRLSQDIVLLQNSVRALRKALVQKAKDLRNTDAANKRIREALKWYGEQARLARLITSEGDAGRNAISADGGTRANTALKGGE